MLSREPDRSSYRSIRRLDETLVNQIAAGEVVERPASAVKELVENSLDAGATTIAVCVLDGGAKEIRVIDDGQGIDREDLLLATERHATSKVRSGHDLEAIETFGFRGEALSSLASVAELEVRSRRPHEPLGHQLRVSFGAPSPIGNVGASPGTTMIVRDLFARLPARQKFLRSAATEFTHITKVFKELALAHPEVEFSLTHQERPVLKYLPKGLPERVSDVLRPDWEWDVFRDEAEFGSVTAFLSPLEFLSERGELSLFVNRRPIRNRTLHSAVRNAYSAVLGPGREPQGAVYLDVRYDWVDVNVHPQKWEVRCFQQERLYAWLLASLRKHVAGLAPPEASPTTRAGTPAFPFSAIGSSAEPPRRRYLGEVGDGYHLAEDAEGLWLFSAHALGERSGTPPARLPSPRLASLSRTRLAVLESRADTVRALGFEAEPFGPAEVALKAYPPLVADEAAVEFLGLCLDELAQGTPPGDTVDFFRTLFKGRGRGLAERPTRPDALTARSLIETAAWNEGDTCVHGRPFLFRLRWDFVGKQFERGN